MYSFVAYEALSSKVDAQNVELEKLWAEVIKLHSLKEAKCKELFERLALTERWRKCIGEHLNTVGQKPDQAADQTLRLMQLGG